MLSFGTTCHLFLQAKSLTIEAGWYFETLVLNYQTARRHIKEKVDSNM
jgi:hypothetical protein